MQIRATESIAHSLNLSFVSCLLDLGIAERHSTHGAIVIGAEQTQIVVAERAFCGVDLEGMGSSLPAAGTRGMSHRTSGSFEVA